MRADFDTEIYEQINNLAQVSVHRHFQLNLVQS
jgi:hypothetical protein